MSNVVGVILAAGVGKRMAPLNSELLKPLLPVGDKRLIEHQLDVFDELGINEVIVVVSGGSKLTEYLSANSPTLDLTFVEQKEHHGIAHALSQTEDYVAGPFLLFLGDIYLRFNDMQRLQKVVKQESASYLVARKEDDVAAIRKNYAIVLDEDEKVRRVIEKPNHPPTNLKGCGLYFFTPGIFDAIRRTPKDHMRNEYELTTAIQVFIDDGFPVYPLEAVDWDFNITHPKDLLECNLRWLSSTGRESFLGVESEINPKARIINSVISSNVIVEHPIEVKDSLILPETRVSINDDIERKIISKDNVVDCG